MVGSNGVKYQNALSLESGCAWAKKACVWLRRDGCREGQTHSCFCGLAFPFFKCSNIQCTIVFSACIQRFEYDACRIIFNKFLCITYFQIYKIIFYENETAACIIFFVISRFFNFTLHFDYERISALLAHNYSFSSLSFCS